MAVADDLYRRAQANLMYLGSAQHRRDMAEAEEKRERLREEKKADKRRIKSLTKRIPRLRDERDGLQAYLEELLLADLPDMSPDEVDHALEGCIAELGDCEEELKMLQEKIYD
jgi:chromosome segregation ATPase